MEELSLNQLYDVEDTASYILRNGYTRVALQFPDQLLKVSVVVSSALREELRKQSHSDKIMGLYILADTTYGSCCADEVAAAHVDAECIIHYGHTCFSQMSKLPVYYVFGKAPIDVKDFAVQLEDYASQCKKRMLVVFEFVYAHARQAIEKKIAEIQLDCGRDSLKILLADVPQREMFPLTHAKDPIADIGASDTKEQQSEAIMQKERKSCKDGRQLSSNFKLGGLSWTLPEGCRMEDIEFVWIGQEGPALTNIMLTFSASTVTCYDPERKLLATGVAKQSKFLMRRYYLVERAKDANIVGILIGTLGVAGYGEMVQGLKRLVKEAGKKSYILAMGRPNPAKLANFPECDIFVLVACSQTALLDSKNYMVPVITPFEAVIAWKRGSQWTGDYSLDFNSLRQHCLPEAKGAGREESAHGLGDEEARFSFIKGSYVEDNGNEISGHETGSSQSLCLMREAERALQMQSGSSSALGTRPPVQSGVEYFALRSFQGLELSAEQTPIQHHIIGQKGRAAVYSNEPGEQPS